MYLLLSFLLIAATSQQPKNVSLLSILVSPEKFDKQFVRIEGFLHNKFEDSALYFSKNDADYLIGKNALWVSFKDDTLKLQPLKKEGDANIKNFDEKFVLIEGYVDSKDKGHMGLFQAGLKNVTRVMELERHYGK